jgi:hypothetical protein
MTERLLRTTQLWLIAVTVLLNDRWTVMRARAERDRDRGDVPGWVMITVMTAIVVIALLAVFRSQVTTAVQKAFGSVNDQMGN